MPDNMFGKIVFITGGQRSGKSSFAQNRAKELSPNPVYLATARVWDDEFKQRIQRHQNERGEEWENIEAEVAIDLVDLDGRTVVLDCITLWLTNIFMDNDGDVLRSLDQAKRIWADFKSQNMSAMVVSNEIGMGVIPENKMARRFADLQGWMNQHIAATADEVILMVSGLPVKVK